MEKIEKNKIPQSLVIAFFVIIIGFAALTFWDPDSPGVSESAGIIGIIEVQGVLEDSSYANILSAAIDEAINDDDIKAVVLEIDSPGGVAYLVEQVYLDVLELKKTKPVVASTSMALSGGYYIAVAADQIFTLPSAMMGNVGVIGVGPGIIIPSEDTFESGPQKITGFSPALFPFNITKAVDSFAQAVEDGRDTRLNIPMKELRKGSVFLGTEAVNRGLADEIGSKQSALEYAASLAELDSYTSESLVARVSDDFVELEVKFPTVAELNQQNPPPALYYLYMPGDIYMQNNDTIPSIEIDAVNRTDFDRLGQVIVDMSHGSRVSPWVLDVLSSELARRNVFVGFSSDWDKVNKSLGQGTTLIIAAPTEYYTWEEYEVIQKFVQDGNMLILMADGSAEFQSNTALMGPINSLANHWGLHFGKGYLYNMDEYYGFYRNIYIDRFRDNFLTEDIDELVFFTSTYLSSSDSDAAFAKYNTYNSVSERRDTYAPISILEKGNTTVIAFADITWLMEPYIYTADNYQLAINLVEAIAEMSTSED